MDPKIANEFPLAAQIILYVGIPMVTGLVVAIAKLWQAKESRDTYIRETDKANLVLLSNLSKALDLMHVDITNLPTDVKDKLTPVLIDLKYSIENRSHAPK